MVVLTLNYLCARNLKQTHQSLQHSTGSTIQENLGRNHGATLTLKVSKMLMRIFNTFRVGQAPQHGL